MKKVSRSNLASFVLNLVRMRKRLWTTFQLARKMPRSSHSLLVSTFVKRRLKN